MKCIECGEETDRMIKDIMDITEFGDVLAVEEYALCIECQLGYDER